MQSIRKIIFSTALIVATCASTVWAQDTLADRKTAASRYMAAVPMSKMLEDSYFELAKQLPEESREEFIGHMRKIIHVSNLEKLAFDSMVETFTAEELNALADFYGSKEGQSALQKFGTYMGRVMPAIQEEIKRALQQQGLQ